MYKHIVLIIDWSYTLYCHTTVSPLGQSGGDDLLGQAAQAVTPTTDVTTNPDIDEERGDEEEEEDEDDVTAVPVSRQHSTTEYLAGMVHSEAPAGLLPKFSSWSLLSMGPFNTYVPAQGKIPYCCD